MKACRIEVSLYYYAHIAALSVAKALYDSIINYASHFLLLAKEPSEKVKSSLDLKSANEQVTTLYTRYIYTSSNNAKVF